MATPTGERQNLASPRPRVALSLQNSIGELEKCQRDLYEHDGFERTRGFAVLSPPRIHRGPVFRFIEARPFLHPLDHFVKSPAFGGKEICVRVFIAVHEDFPLVPELLDKVAANPLEAAADHLRASNGGSPLVRGKLAPAPQPGNRALCPAVHHFGGRAVMLQEAFAVVAGDVFDEICQVNSADIFTTVA